MHECANHSRESTALIEETRRHLDQFGPYVVVTNPLTNLMSAPFQADLKSMLARVSWPDRPDGGVIGYACLKMCVAEVASAGKEA